MGRPPCSEKTRVKKGPWSPEEDLLLVSYVQEHGAGNWHVVPANTGLMRCSKSCRLRWTNYLRPGIKRGNFSDQEEKVIIKLQQLLGNRWSAIASYMPDRTDNDIKNYWNTHMKKKLAKTSAAPSNKGQWEHHLQTDFHTARQVFQEALSMDIVPLAIKPEPLPPAQLPKPDISLTMYPSSIKNIARLLEAWMCPNASAKASVVSPVSGGGEGGSRSNNGMTHMLEGFTGATKVEGTSGAGPGPSSSLLMGLECWLLDDGMGRGDTGLIGMLLVDPCGFFRLDWRIRKKNKSD